MGPPGAAFCSVFTLIFYMASSATPDPNLGNVLSALYKQAAKSNKALVLVMDKKKNLNGQERFPEQASYENQKHNQNQGTSYNAKRPKTDQYKPTYQFLDSFENQDQHQHRHKQQNSKHRGSYEYGYNPQKHWDHQHGRHHHHEHSYIEPVSSSSSNERPYQQEYSSYETLHDHHQLRNANANKQVKGINRDAIMMKSLRQLLRDSMNRNKKNHQVQNRKQNNKKNNGRSRPDYHDHHHYEQVHEHYHDKQPQLHSHYDSHEHHIHNQPHQHRHHEHEHEHSIEPPEFSHRKPHQHSQEAHQHGHYDQHGHSQHSHDHNHNDYQPHHHYERSNLRQLADQPTSPAKSNRKEDNLYRHSNDFHMKNSLRALRTEISCKSQALCKKECLGNAACEHECEQVFVCDDKGKTNDGHSPVFKSRNKCSGECTTKKPDKGCTDEPSECDDGCDEEEEKDECDKDTSTKGYGEPQAD